MKKILLELDNLEEATIIKRPSLIIKSPYVADILVNGKELLGHCPSLGCQGLCENYSKVFVQRLCERKCHYKICLAKISENKHSILIGIEPKLAEKIAYNALKYNLIKDLSVKSIKKEQTFLNSRFDFSGVTQNNQVFICEVKNVPLADYADLTKKERAKMDFSDKKFNEKIAYFPDGYRKNKSTVVSERALKHINELAQIKENDPEIRCILLYVIQRSDVSSFQPSNLDPIYLNAVKEAIKKGVEIKTLQIAWKRNQAIFLGNSLPINNI